MRHLACNHRYMTYRNRRSNLALFIACALVSAIATAPGWTDRETPQAPVVATTTGVVDDSAAIIAPPPPPATLSSTTDEFDADLPPFANAAADAHDSDAAIAPAHASATDADIVFGELQRAAGVEAEAYAGQDRPVQLAALGGSAIRTLGGAGAGAGAGRGSQGAQPANPGATPDATDTSGDQGKHSGQPGEGAGPVESMPAAPPSDAGDDTHDDVDEGDPATTTPLPPVSDDPIDLTPIDAWPDPQLPYDPPATQPVSVPEPSTLGLLALGLAGIAAARRRRATLRG